MLRLDDDRLKLLVILQPPNLTLGLLGFLGALAFGGCTPWPGLEEPTLRVAPELVLLRMKGDTRMQSNASGSFNPSPEKSRVDDLGGGDRDDDLAVTLSYGNGFSGFDFYYLLVDQRSTTLGVTRDDWGAVKGGATVNTETRMDELRLRYLAELPSLTYEDEDEEYRFKIGVGAQISHRELNFTVDDVASAISQKIEIKEEASPYLAIRVTGGTGPIAITVDYAYHGDWSLGNGDMHGNYDDLSILASYFLEGQELTIFGGYRRFEVPAQGSEGMLKYEADFTFDGYVFGVEFLF